MLSHKSYCHVCFAFKKSNLFQFAAHVLACNDHDFVEFLEYINFQFFNKKISHQILYKNHGHHFYVLVAIFLFFVSFLSKNIAKNSKFNCNNFKLILSQNW